MYPTEAPYDLRFVCAVQKDRLTQCIGGLWTNLALGIAGSLEIAKLSAMGEVPLTLSRGSFIAASSHRYFLAHRRQGYLDSLAINSNILGNCILNLLGSFVAALPDFTELTEHVIRCAEVEFWCPETASKGFHCNNSTLPPENDNDVCTVRFAVLLYLSVSLGVWF